jgi:pyruvate-formate lyase-activating enzyme
MPVIRGYNDSPENILETAKFMNDNGLFEINILPFHRLGDSKYEQLGMSYGYSDEEPTSAGVMDEIQDMFLDQEIACYVGYATPF